MSKTAEWVRRQRLLLTKINFGSFSFTGLQLFQHLHLLLHQLLKLLPRLIPEIPKHDLLPRIGFVSKERFQPDIDASPSQPT